jgi:DNA mismatch repair protein MutS
MAGMPTDIVLRSNEILKQQEKDKLPEEQREQLAGIPTQNFQLNLFEADPRIEKLMQLLRGTDINTLSPVEALLKLNEMKEVLKK